MRNNKGFSLVELLVTITILAIVMTEISALMINSSKLYLNGAREVALQTEAQLVIQQLEDLMVDAAGSVSHNYDASISSDRFITINMSPSVNKSTGSPVSENIVYTVEYVRDMANPYGQLYLSQSGGTDDFSAILLADYVGSISLNMANFYDNDIVTLNLVMQNEQYSYDAVQDIFCRNLIGTKRDTLGNKHTSVTESTLSMNRYATLSLNEVFYTDIYNFEKENGGGYTYSFEWLPAVKGIRTPEHVYHLTQNGSNYYLTCHSDLLKVDNYGKSYPNSSTDPDCVLICYAEKAGVKTEIVKAKITTGPVAIGLGVGPLADGKTSTSKYGYGLVFPSGVTSSGYFSAIKMQGIDPDYCTKIDYKFELLHFNMPSTMSDLEDTTQYPMDSDVDDELAKISYDVSFNGVFQSGSWDTGATEDNPGFKNTSVTGTIEWAHFSVNSHNFFEEMGGAANVYKLNNLGFESDSLSNSIFIHTDRIVDGSLDKYFDQVRKGYLLTGRFTFYFPGNKKLEYETFFIPNADGAGLGDLYMKNSYKTFYKMLSLIPEPTT